MMTEKLGPYREGEEMVATCIANGGGWRCGLQTQTDSPVPPQYHFPPPPGEKVFDFPLCISFAGGLTDWPRFFLFIIYLLTDQCQGCRFFL